MNAAGATAAREARAGAVSAALPTAVGMPQVFLALMSRDLRVARRELPWFLVRVGLQPIMLTTVFGFLLPQMGFIGRGSGTVTAHYTTTLLPGILALSLTLSSIQSVALPMVQDFGFTREIEDRLLAPVETWVIAAEKIVMGILQGFIAGLFVLPAAWLIMGHVPGVTLGNMGLTFGITLLGAAAFSALGLWLGTAISGQQIGLMFSVIVAPMIMFGCTYYPWRGLDAVPAVKYAVLINPLVYVAEGMRAVLTPGVPHMPLGAVVGALLAFTTMFLILGYRTFRRRAIG